MSGGILCSKISKSDSGSLALIGEFTLKTKNPRPVGSAGILSIQTQGSLLFEFSFDAQIWRKIERKLAVSDGWVNRFLNVLVLLVLLSLLSIAIFLSRNPDLRTR